MRWTNQKVAHLVELRESGASRKLMARLMDISPDAVKSKLRALGLPPIKRTVASRTLASEIAAARFEASTAPPFKPGRLEW